MITVPGELMNELAEILANLDGEDFVIPDAVAESYADVDIP